MSPVKELDTSPNIPEDVIFPPSDLYSDEPPLETELHLRQIILLFKCLEWLWRDRTDFYAAGNLTIYYSLNKHKSQDFRGPDFFVVLDTERKTRKSWVVWEEDGKYPNFILEILSESTANTDKEFKKKLYQNTFRTPDYFWFDPSTLEFAGFHLLDGKYQPLEANSQGHLWSQQLDLYLGIHQGLLRFFAPSGELVPTPEEEAEFERQQKELAINKAERLAAKLRELNIDPDTI
ncbi:Uma2 family endonuclease [Aetokthonos hydrillicola Thurmond2011]|jgi:Uma2 family endonuclease|uniref:Uma2 family endonuclease n=1 Tax=Aetokthonos hydrillicola Thurmond2011 TaxID=2712845 RepID=A0AAP5I943_9CYAN|nr:Uma2 family endonuclease [Aetokthonos hydrillicola]MBO3457787.1 Uma2 family endonuclease [Aetokthonos hydrillicola CCALA 1050]MBW4588355.1 Uma2 family endonuclease [Aetokthonos hydrillicola CCALA 1050]MDR9897161.1 Uma2 family endonuclease [Aetokthonos hydrillicola Thurmond2011]